AEPVGYGDVHGFGPDGGRLYPMDGKISDDATMAPGSGADRFRLIAGKDYRLKVAVRGGPGPSPGSGGTSGAGGAGAPGTGGTAGGTGSGGAGEVDMCSPPPAPPAMPSDVRITPVADPKHSHEWGHLHFVVSPSQAEIHDYEVRVSEKPITASDPTSFTQGRQANVAALEDGMLVVPPGGAPGTSVDVDFGHLNPDTTYFVAIRAKNTCAEVSDYAIGSFTTTRINFTKLSGCFVATAAFGSAMEPRVESLRQARDALRSRSELFAAATDLYYRSGPVAASIISRSDSLRALARTLLAPIVAAAQTASPLTGAPSIRGARASAASGSSPGRRGFAAPASR
ncbi:MAG TPA: CFI-box-CTERM domain-containing protein, partial [Polyangia bacterium]